MLYPRAAVMLMETFRGALRLQFNGFTDEGDDDLAQRRDLVMLICCGSVTSALLCHPCPHDAVST